MALDGQGMANSNVEEVKDGQESESTPALNEVDSGRQRDMATEYRLDGAHEQSEH